MTENNHTDRAHALLSPSSAKRWMTCKGSTYLAQKCPPQETSKFAEEGTKAHEFCELLLKSTLAGHTWGQYVDEDNEMHMHCVAYVNFILALREKYKKILYEAIEKQVTVSKDIWGTADYILVAEREHGWVEICVVDFKYGRGVEVGVTDNEQLKIYALGAWLDNKITFEDNSLNLLRMFIFQPRVGDGKPTRFDMNLIETFLWNTELKEASDIALSFTDENPPTLNDFTVGDHCRFCPANPCQAFIAHQSKESLVCLDDTQPFPISISTLSIEQKVQIQKNKKRIEQALSANESELMTRLQTGFEVPGFKLVESKGKRTWIDDDNLVAEKLKERGVDPYRNQLITIGTAEKKLGKNQIGDLTKEPGTRFQIVSTDDEREEITGNTLDLLD